MIIDTAKDFLDGKTFGIIIGYPSVIFHFLCGLGITTFAAVLSAGESGKFSCYVDAKSSNVHKKQVDQSCFIRYDQAYNSPLPLYGFVLLSFGCAVLISVTYSLIVRIRVKEIESSHDKQNHDKSRTTPVDQRELSNEDKSKDHEKRKTVYVFISYFFHLVLRVSLGIGFNVSQYTYFYSNGFPLEFNCNYNSTTVSCENPKASHKRFASILVCIANITVAFVALMEVIYLLIRLAIRCHRYGGSLNVDFEFVIEYFLGKQYGNYEEESTGNNNQESLHGEVIPLQTIRINTPDSNSDQENCTGNDTEDFVPSECAPLLASTENSTMDNNTQDNGIKDSSIDPDCGIQDYSNSLGPIAEESTGTKSGTMDNNIQHSRSKYKEEALKRHAHEINYLPNKSLDDFFVDIVIQPGRARGEFSKDRKREEIDNISAKVPPTSTCLIKDLFHCNEDTTEGNAGRSILVIGRPGIGKTVLAEKIFRDWANENKYEINDYYRDKVAFIFKIRCFSTNVKELSNVSLKEFLQFETSLSDDEFERIYEEITDKPQNVILIFDGLDEFHGNYTDCLDECNRISNKPDTYMLPIHLFVKLVKGNILNGAKILVTSRPTAHKFYAKLDFDEEVEICGFEDDKIKDYVTRFCENLKTRSLEQHMWERIESSGLLKLCDIPVTCFIVCVCLWGPLSKSGNDTGGLPTTLTNLFQKALLYYEDYEQNRNATGCNSVKEGTSKKLKQLAFDGVKNRQLIFDEEEVDERLKKSCVLTSLSDSPYTLEAKFCFIDETMQAFLAAKHVIEMDVPEIEEFISRNVADDRWHLVLQFIAGLLGKKIKKPEAWVLYKDCVLAFAESIDVKSADGSVEISGNNVFVKKCFEEMDLDNEITEDIYKTTGMNNISSLLCQSFESDILSSEQAAMASVCEQPKHLSNSHDHVPSEVSKSWLWIENSIIHREKLEKLCEYGQAYPKKIKEINNVRVCFSKEFLIGRGSDATRVYVGLGKDGYERAVKRLPKDVCTIAEQEKKILNKPNAIASRHVVRYWYLDDESDIDWVFLIIDLCEETLKEYVKRRSDCEEWSHIARDIIHQVLSGLADLHRAPNTILHRDLKPSNILRNVHDKWLLADFGISRILVRDETTHVSIERGTNDWRAVESVKPCSPKTMSKAAEVHVRYKRESDIQVAGMVAFYILTKGEHPFGEEPDRQRNLLDGDPVYLDKLTDRAARDLISWMLNHDPKDRPSAEEALKHPYLQSKSEQVELLCKMGNQREIKTGDNSSNVVATLNADPTDWRSSIRPDVLKYLCTVVVHGRSRIVQYASSWTDCLRLIRNVSLHWDDRPRPLPKPEAFCIVGDVKEYFLNVFPDLPARVHRIVRSSDWKERPDFREYFTLGPTLCRRR